MHPPTAGRDIVREAMRDHGDDPANEIPLAYKPPGRTLRIDVPIQSIVSYRDALRDIIRECHRQLEDSTPARMRGRHTGLVLTMYRETWRQWSKAWKRRG